jgi:secernin
VRPPASVAAVCDTLCAIEPGGTLFAKNSDRPVSEVQLVATHGRRAPGGLVRTQYLEIPDEGAAATLLARPVWLWGAEHGVSERRLAGGNEKVYTKDDPYEAPPALIGMDLVRLALERAGSAAEAVEVVTGLLRRYGQGGVADATAGEPYFSSFLFADPRDAFVLETSGRTFAARRVQGAAAISNRLTLRRDFEIASPDVPEGSDFDAWRSPLAPTGHADVRLAASEAFLSCTGGRPSPKDAAAHLRDHGTGPMERFAPPAPPPELVLPDGTGVSVCLHARGYQATTSSMIAWLPVDEDEPLRAWVAPGSPCVSVFVPVFPPAPSPPALADEAVWRRVAALRDEVEAEPERLASVRSALDPLEAELWEEADELASDPSRWPGFAASVDLRIREAFEALVPPARVASEVQPLR